MNKVAHFEIPADDKERAKKFYNETFGWQITDFPIGGDVIYSCAQTVATDETTSIPKENSGLSMVRL